MSLGVLTSRLMLGLNEFVAVVKPQAYQDEVQDFVKARKLRKAFYRRKSAEDLEHRTKIQFMSDLYLERIEYDFDIAANAPFLLLAGDIGRFCDREAYKSFLVKQCEQFDLVLLLAGNQEFYGLSREEGLATAKAFADDAAMKGKLKFLDRRRIDLPGTDVTVLGCTLHSNIALDCTALTNDFKRIKGWTVLDHNAEHERELAWLKASLDELAEEEQPRRVVIATHYAPSFEKTTHPANEHSAVSQCFSSDSLKDFCNWTGSELVVTDWIFGHTHWNTKFRAGHVLVQSNHFCNDSSRLSWWQKKTLYRPFDPAAIIEL